MEVAKEIVVGQDQNYLPLRRQGINQLINYCAVVCVSQQYNLLVFERFIGRDLSEESLPNDLGESELALKQVRVLSKGI